MHTYALNNHTSYTLPVIHSPRADAYVGELQDYPPQKSGCHWHGWMMVMKTGKGVMWAAMATMEMLKTVIRAVSVAAAAATLRAVPTSKETLRSHPERKSSLKIRND
jgi:hypothetical protein